MNYYYDYSSEVKNDLELAQKLHDEDFERHFNMDINDRDQFIKDLESDLQELIDKEDKEEDTRINGYEGQLPYKNADIALFY